jgi:FtsP/CotA-like multicopper oxidase with cupredoxin domain
LPKLGISTQRFVALIALVSLGVAPVGAQTQVAVTGGARAAVQRSAAPAARARTQATAPARSLAAVPTPATGGTLLSEGFSAGVTSNAWKSFGSVCLTAATAVAPAGSIAACGSNAPQDAVGQGALQLTPAHGSRTGGVIATTPLSTANGLQVTFTDYTFDGTTPGADGLAFFFTDASKPFPTGIGVGGGGLGYEDSPTAAGLPNAYLGIGLEEYGGFSSPNDANGGPGRVPESIAVRGAAAINYAYLGGVTNAAGTAASLPFALDTPTAATRPANAPTVQATLTAAGALTIAVDHHDGNGFVTYYSATIVGLNGQPAVPANVYFGMSASTGGDYEVHQVTGLVIASLPPTTQATTLVNESFNATASTPSLWQGFGDACLTAGTTATPKTSVKACGAAAPVDVAGSGALQLTKSAVSRTGGVVEHTPLPTANGLVFTFTDYAFNGTTPGADGVALFLTDASQPFPTHIGDAGGALGFEGTAAAPGVQNAYVGIGFEEYGGYSQPQGGNGGPGRVPESIAVRGATSINYEYLGGYTNGAGAAASLPFALDTPAATARPATAPTIQATLTAGGLLSVAIDIHNGAGFVTYYSQTIVGVNGEPAVPANVYLGISAATGGNHQSHQIANLTVTTIGTAAASKPAPDNNPPQVVSSDGSLTFNISAQSNAATGNPQFLYNGSAVPPTLRLLPGDTLVVNLTNSLPPPPAGAGYTNSVNLHYHGLHVSPQAPGDDEIDMLAAPGQSLHYTIQIPTNHPTGLYWYHTHVHGEAERDTLSGLSGALIIDGIAAYTPQVAGMTERVLVIRDTPLPGAILPNANLAQTYAMKWAMQHGIAMHASGPGTSGRASTGGKTELHASSTMKSANPYAFVDAKYRNFARSTAADQHCVAGNPEAPVLGLTLNGQTQPALRIAPGEQQFWRVVNAGADTYVDFTVDNAQLQIIALDGTPLSLGTNTPASMTVGDWVLPPASRAEFLITGPPAGTTAYVRTNCFDAGPSGNPMPAAILASINPAAATVAADPAVGRISPKAVRYRFHTNGIVRSTGLARSTLKVHSAASVRAATITATRTLYYSDQNNINGIAYDPAAPPQFYSQTGSVEQWTIQNNSYQVHTFHIHQVHFLVQAINGVAQSQQYLIDNVNVPAATASGPGSVTLLLDFTDPTIIGTFLLHCHILSHEDGGMMAKIRIGTAPPLNLSTGAVTFATPTSGAQQVTITGGAAPYSVTGCAGVAAAAVNAATIAIFPAAPGACILTVADSSNPSLTGTLQIQVNGSAPVVTLSAPSVSFTSPAAATQNVTIIGGTAPYSASGCANIATAAITGQSLSVAPLAAGVCSVVVTDTDNNTATLAVAVNAANTANPLDNVTFHNNALRTGWYQNESVLNEINVNATNFGQVATLAAPAGMPALGKVYAQPLFATNEMAVDGNVHNLVVVAGSAAQIYAFDESTQAVVWHRDFTNAALNIRQQVWTDTECSDVNPNVGIIGTPVIDRSLDRLYVVVATMENGVPYTRLHAIGLGTGTDVIPPTVISGSVTLATGGTASISSLNNMNRSALLEADGNIYVALGSHCDAEANTVHGWVMAFNATTLQETGSLVDLTNANSGNNFYLGAVWMAGYGPAADAAGNIYFATGNGPWNGSTDFGMSVMEVPGNLNLAGATYFTPIQEAADSLGDQDIGSGGVMLLPDQTTGFPHLLVAGGKCSVGTIGCIKYLLNRDNLGGQQANNAGALWSGNVANGVWGGPAYFVDSTGAQHIEYGAPLTTLNLTTNPYNLVYQSATNIGCLECRDQGSQPIVSSNGTVAGTPVVWALKTPGNAGGAITLYAWNPFNMGTPLFSAQAGVWNQTPGTAWIGGALVSPTVANGRVYVPSDGQVSVFGLLSTAAINPNARARKH